MVTVSANTKLVLVATSPANPKKCKTRHAMSEIRRPFATVAIALGSIVAGACSPPPASMIAPTVVIAPFVRDSGTLAVRCGALIDGIGDSPQRNVTVLIEGGRIREVGPDVRVPPQVPVLDLSDYTVLPGLIDLHTHLNEGPEDTADLSVFLHRTYEEAAERGRRKAATTLAAGFTSVRNVGTYLGGSTVALRDEIAAGTVVGPRMQVASFYLTVPGGGGDLLLPGVAEADIPAHLRMGVARGAEQFRAKAQQAIDSGADVIKIIASGAVLAYGGVPGEPEMTPDEIAAVVEVAHRAGKKVAAHAHGARSIKEAILAGVDTIEHASLMDDEAIRLAIEHHVALLMDVYNGDYIETEGRRLNWPKEFLDKNLATTEAQRQAFTAAHRAGATIVFGSDSGVYPHGDNARQFKIMVERGMTPIEAIRAATSLAADTMDWSDRVGAVVPDRLGDLIAVRGDPLADITVLERVEVVIQGGLVLKLP